ncbi:energy-coupling factor transporter transmembrane protein EcfT [Brevibacterium litoralis]|uniref:energy-coupling factor transporter transmembrane protein EcfT n=1 Tax=Brevibacterium litoralis TaxID=3138935 RepID=UPI0032EFE67C
MKLLQHVPMDTWLHRIPTPVRFAVLVVLGIVVLLVREPWVNGLVIAGVCSVGATARIPWRYLLRPYRAVWVLVLAVLLVQGLLVGPWAALTLSTTLLACVGAAGLFMLTTSQGEILALFALLCAPLGWPGIRRLGVPPERPALAAALMIRSIAHIAGLAATAGDAARARGLDRDLRARTVPVVLGTVAHAERVGKALDARGLG